MGEKKILECSTKGDRRFSAFYAKVNICGTNDSIENHYQGCKRFYNHAIHETKGKEPDFIIVDNVKLGKQFLTPFYKLLWVIYLDMNPLLVEYASKFDDFHDIFKGKKSLNCQADVIRQYMKDGSDSILKEPDVILLLDIMKKVREKREMQSLERLRVQHLEDTKKLGRGLTTPIVYFDEMVGVDCFYYEE